MGIESKRKATPDDEGWGQEGSRLAALTRDSAEVTV